jgi:hypothetical protein
MVIAMFIEIQGFIHNMDIYSKVTRELISEGAGENKIIFWDKTSNIEFFRFGADDEVGLLNVLNNIKTVTGCTPV